LEGGEFGSRLRDALDLEANDRESARAAFEELV
jgi:hypothetical protein